MSEHDRPRRARSHPLGVPTTIEDEGTGARRSRLATMQAFQAAAEPIVKRVDGLERDVRALDSKVDDIIAAQHEQELATVEHRAEVKSALATLLARKAVEDERAKTTDARRWDLWKMLLGPLIAAAAAFVAGRLSS